jgi:hypothetical protein
MGATVVEVDLSAVFDWAGNAVREPEGEDEMGLPRRGPSELDNRLPLPQQGEPDEAVAMRRWCDEMQSEASRLASIVIFDKLPYEARMALVSMQALVQKWTELRLAAGREQTA